MSPTLRMEVAMESNAIWLVSPLAHRPSFLPDVTLLLVPQKKIPFFQTIDEECLGKLAATLWPEVYAPKDHFSILIAHLLQAISPTNP